MSELYVKRQALTKNIRKQEIEQYIKGCRTALEAYRRQQAKQQEITSQELDKLYNDLEQYNYNEASLLNFLKILQIKKTGSLTSPVLLVRIKIVLKYMENSRDKEEGIKIVEKISLRLVSQCVKFSNFLDNCFRELLELIGQHQFGLNEVWPNVALIRNEIYFQYSFRQFIRYIRSFPSEIDHIISTILKTFVNFTSEIESNTVKLTFADYFEIIDSITTIFQNYTLGDADMRLAALAVKNILYIVKEIEMTNLPAALKHFLVALQYQEQRKQKMTDETIKQILSLICVATAGQVKQVLTIIKFNPNIIKNLCRLLPIQNTFKKIKISRPVQWLHRNKIVIIGTLHSLCNIASLQYTGFQLMSTGTLSAIVELSAYLQDSVRGEVAIFIWNMIISGSNIQQTQILCENDILYALGNVLQADHSHQALEYGLKCLMQVLTNSKNFPPNNLAWRYNFKNVKLELIKNNTKNLIQRQICSKSVAISKLAQQCLIILNDGQEQIL